MTGELVHCGERTRHGPHGGPGGCNGFPLPAIDADAVTPDPGGTLDGVADCGEDVCQHLPTCEEVSELMAHPDPGGMVGAYAADDALVATQRACTCPKWDEAGFPSRTCPAHAGRWLA